MKGSKNARHRARILAVQALYQVDVTGVSGEQALATALHMGSPEGEGAASAPGGDAAAADAVDLEYARHLVETACADRPRYDALIAAASANWRLERIGRLDAQILRVGAVELANGLAPRPVVIDEAVEIAREYCGDEARAFVNGVLDGVARGLGASREATR